MIRSIICCKPRLPTSIRAYRIERRLFAHSAITDDCDNEDLKDDDKNSVLDLILNSDGSRDSIAYSLAMASLEGSKFPPLSRCLNDRQREQIRISRSQQRHFRGNGEHQQMNNTISEEQRRDHQTLLKTIAEDTDACNSVAYSLSMTGVPNNPGFPPLTRSLNEREKEQLRISQDQLQTDRMQANKQLYGDEKIENDATSFSTDDLQAETEEYETDSLAMSYSLSFASSLNEGSVTFPQLTRHLNGIEDNQLRISKSQLSTSTYPEKRRQHHPLPRTLTDALRPSSEAIVITEIKKPFRVFNVNSAWEGLCGYSYVESKGKSLGSLLSGKETDTCAVTALIHQLFVHGEEATTVLTNYTKEGRKFRNRLSVGPLYDEETGELSHFVGVLKEVSVAM